jgi:glutamine synthetase
MNRDEAQRWLADEQIECVRLIGTNHDGVPLGKHVAPAKFSSVAERGTPVSDVAFGIDLSGEVAVGWDWGQWRSGNVCDIVIRPDLDTLVRDPLIDGWASAICDFEAVDGTPVPVCYRSALKRLVAQLAERGFEAIVAMELEFTVFEESLAQARQQGFRDLHPLGGEALITYQVDRSPDLARFMDALMRRLDALGIPWETWTTETSPGQVEVNVAAADPVTAADWAIRTKLAIREVAYELGHTATFMARCDEERFGAGMHVNQSLVRDGANAFYDAAAEDGMSETMRHWLGGLMATLPAAMSFLTPNINSYRRLAELSGPPTTATWADDNKTTAIRTIAREPKTARIEHRVPSADCNPYLALAAMFAGGLAGLERRIEPPPRFEGMAWGLPPGVAEQLPNTIRRAARALEADQLLADILGPEMVDYWLGSREWEWTIFHLAGGDPDKVADYELQRYFERV